MLILPLRWKTVKRNNFQCISDDEDEYGE